MVPLIIYLVISVLCLVVLGVTDPKRLGRRGTKKVQSYYRRSLVLLSLLPGIWLLFNLEGAFFLIWFGSVSMAGWIVALLLRERLS